MNHLPRHSGHDDEAGVSSSRSRTTRLVVVLAVLVIVVGIVVLHVTGVIHGH